MNCDTSTTAFAPRVSARREDEIRGISGNRQLIRDIHGERGEI